MLGISSEVLCQQQGPLSIDPPLRATQKTVFCSFVVCFWLVWNSQRSPCLGLPSVPLSLVLHGIFTCKLLKNSKRSFREPCPSCLPPIALLCLPSRIASQILSILLFLLTALWGLLTVHRDLQCMSHSVSAALRSHAEQLPGASAGIVS